MSKNKVIKPKRRIPVPQKPPKVESNKKKYKRKQEKKILKQFIEDPGKD